jgi:hypothetical protein
MKAALFFVVVATVVVAGALLARPDRAACGAPMSTLETSSNPPELGLVRWRRGYPDARAAARQSGKPLLVLFDEVPGCSTVNAFGKDVLADPVVADAADLFEAVFVANNAEGDDRRVLRHFGEPAWNNPVIRFLDVDEQALAPRLEGADRRVHLLSRMVEALTRAQRPVPAWLRAAADDKAAAEEAVYAMGCFWEGEVALGAVDGVTGTTPGFAGGHEAVRVRYDPAQTTRAQLDAQARARGFSVVDAAGFVASAKDDKFQIASNALGKLPLTATQRMRINSAVGHGDNPRTWLSPRQERLLDATACQGGPRDD